MAEGIRPYFLFTVTGQNYRDLEPFSSFCHTQSLGFRISLVRSKIPPRDQLLERVGSHLSDFYERLGKTMPLNLRFERDAKFAEWNLSKKKALACGTCRNYVAIDQNGLVSSCQMAMDKPHGNLLREDLSRNHAVGFYFRGFYPVKAGRFPTALQLGNGLRIFPSNRCHQSRSRGNFYFR